MTSSRGLLVELLDALSDSGWTVPEGALAATNLTPPCETYLERTDGTSRLLVRPKPDGGVEVLLTNPLDPSLPEGTDGIDGELAAAHERICASAVENVDGIDVIADGRVLLVVRFDVDEAPEAVKRRVAAIDRVAAETDRLHQAIRETVSGWARADEWNEKE